MAEVKWIKITTDIFDDDKIKIIDRMPARDEILVIWFKLLALAGKVNEGGLLFLNNRIAYTTDMLSAVFNREENTVKMAFTIFQKYGMIHIEDNDVIAITNWEKHQNVDGLDKMRKQNALRQKEHRERQKLLCNSNVISNVTSHRSNATDIELELDLEREKEKRKRTREKKVTEPSEPTYEPDTRSKFEVCLDEFKSFRKSIKKPMTDHAVNLLLKNLNDLAKDEDTKIKIMEQSIVNNWAGVFALKPNQSYGKNNDSDTDNIFMKIGREER